MINNNNIWIFKWHNLTAVPIYPVSGAYWPSKNNWSRKKHKRDMKFFFNWKLIDIISCTNVEYRKKSKRNREYY